MPVVAPLELHQQVASRGAAREADRAHRRLGPARDEPHPLDARHRVDHTFGEGHLQLGGGPEGRSEVGRALRRRDDLGPGVAEQQGAPGLHEVDVAVAVGVPDPRAFTALVEAGGATDRAEGTHRGIDAARDHPPCAIEELLVAPHGP
jgi:hypothetical protein